MVPLDMWVLMALHKLWEIKGKTQSIKVNMYEILKACHMNASGGAYKRLEQSLMRLFRAEVMFQEIGEEYEEKEFFHLIQGVNFKLKKAENGYDASFTIVFTDIIYKSMILGSFDRYSGALIADLSSDAAQILVPALQAQWRNKVFKWKLDEVCQMIHLESPKTYARKNTISKALAELEAVGHVSQSKLWEDYSGTVWVQAYPGPLLIEEGPIQTYFTLEEAAATTESD